MDALDSRLREEQENQMRTLDALLQAARSSGATGLATAAARARGSFSGGGGTAGGAAAADKEIAPKSTTE